MPSHLTNCQCEILRSAFDGPVEATGPDRQDIQLLERIGLVRKDVDGKFRITAAGQRYVEFIECERSS